MKRLAVLIVLALGACDGPFETPWPPQYLTTTYRDQVLDVRLQKDVLEGWTAFLRGRDAKISKDAREDMIGIVANELGPKVCTDQRPLVVKPDGKIWHGYHETVMYLPDLGAWKITGVCEGAII